MYSKREIWTILVANHQQALMGDSRGSLSFSVPSAPLGPSPTASPRRSLTPSRVVLVEIFPAV